MRLHGTRIVAAMLEALLALGCSHPLAPDHVAVPARVLDAPLRTSVEGVPLALDAYVWRDFMPGNTDSRMIASLRLRSASGRSLPAGLTVDQAWVIHGRDVWTPTPRQERPGTAAMLEVMGREGPLWRTGDSVDVVVEVHAGGGGRTLLRAPRTVIQRTE